MIKGRALRLFFLAGPLVALVFVPLMTASSVAAQPVDSSTSVGVVVDPPPSPPTTAAPPATSPPAPPPIPPPPPEVTTTLPRPTSSTTQVPLGGDGSDSSGVGTGLLDTPPDPDQNADSSTGKSIIDQVKSALSTTKELFDNIFSGKPVVDAVREFLPGSVAAVVVPAVQATATFAFPIGLAMVVLGFLAIQQRIDSSDPKLSAAPLAHDDELVAFQ